MGRTAVVSGGVTATACSAGLKISGRRLATTLASWRTATATTPAGPGGRVSDSALVSVVAVVAACLLGLTNVERGGPTAAGPTAIVYASGRRGPTGALSSTEVVFTTHLSHAVPTERDVRGVAGIAPPPLATWCGRTASFCGRSACGARHAEGHLSTAVEGTGVLVIRGRSVLRRFGTRQALLSELGS